MDANGALVAAPLDIGSGKLAGAAVVIAGKVVDGDPSSESGAAAETTQFYASDIWGKSG